MPKIIVRADIPGGDTDLVTLTERIVAANFLSRHYTTQFVERICWATAHAEALESEARAPESDAKLRGATRPIRERVSAPAAISADANAGNRGRRLEPARGSLEPGQQRATPARPRVTAIEPLRTSTIWCGG